MAAQGSQMDELRAKVEQLALLEIVAESRQQQLEELLDTAVSSGGLDADEIRDELGLSEESIHALMDGTTPDLHERLGISRRSAKQLRNDVTAS